MDNNINPRKVFVTRAGTTHELFGHGMACWAVSRGRRPPAGHATTMTSEEFASAKKCAKCFPIINIDSSVAA